jgi:hypothetical protein
VRLGCVWCAAVLAAAMLASSSVQAWGQPGHRLVALVASGHLTAAARAGVSRLLPDSSLAGVAVWADDMVAEHSQTGLWHYVNIPDGAAGYDRDRDCPRQAGARAGSRNDRWRDCAVDRILQNQERLADSRLDRADRAIALKYLVHFIGDLHQPMHALGRARGGNDIPVVAFGSSTCHYPDGTPVACQLHGIWDSTLVARRGLNERQYLEDLNRLIRTNRLAPRATGTPADWANESYRIAIAAIPDQGVVDEAYYRKHIDTINERLALGGLRLAAALNRALSGSPPR